VSAFIYDKIFILTFEIRILRISQLDCSGKTPLHFAAKGGEDAICKMLIEAGAKLDALDCVSSD